jgi:hypothetical protein
MGEMSVALAVLETMAADSAFRPYLADCIGNKQDVLGRAFPDRFLRLVSEVRGRMLGGVPN